MEKYILSALFLLCRLCIAAQPDHPVAPQRVQVEGDIKTIDFTVNTITLLKSIYPGLRGTGITICQKEDAPDPKDIDLTGRLLPSGLTSGLVTDHATTIATIMAGAGNSSPLSMGIAPKASIVSVNLQSLYPEGDDFYTYYHVTVGNHSYGTEIENYYGDNAVAYDVSANRLPGMLHVFSSGNIGYTSGTDGQYGNLPGVANLTGNFKMAKNVLVIGAVDASGQIVASSSRGPAYDGRVKPELVAYSEEGTSEAAAIVSGACGLLQQLFSEQTGSAAPSALIKSVLVNSADDAGPPGIDFQSGYGSINAYEAAKTIAENRYFKGTVSNGGSMDFSINVPSVQQLKVTLAWNDPAASANSAKALVNDLDLELLGQDTWKPWVLSRYPDLDSLQQPAVRGRDTLNNVEQVSIEGAPGGNYTIRIKGAKVTSGTQDFYIAYQWETPDSFYWIAPNSETLLISDTTVIVRWKNTFSVGSGRLAFSTDKGNNWVLLKDSIALKDGSFQWHTPAMLGAIRLKMTIASHEFTTGDFMVSPLTEVTVKYVCSDSIGLGWDTGAFSRADSAYVLYKFDYTHAAWTAINTLTGYHTVLKGTGGDDVFAIAPLDSGQVGLKSDFISRQNVYCYYKNLSAFVIEGATQVDCELSTTEEVLSITFQKYTLSGILDLDTAILVAAGNTFYSGYDASPKEGGNTYRVKIVLTNGAVIYSGYTNALYFNQKTFLVYPNPVQAGDVLTISAKDYGDYSLRLYDPLGRVVQEEEVSADTLYIATTALPPGTYFYEIRQDNQPLERGKVMVR